MHPFGACARGAVTQGVALGWLGAGLWPFRLSAHGFQFALAEEVVVFVRFGFVGAAVAGDDHVDGRDYEEGE